MGGLRELCLMEVHIMERLQAAGHPIGPGTTGENLLIDGLEPDVLGVGVQLRVGGVQLTITKDAPPPAKPFVNPFRWTIQAAESSTTSWTNTLVCKRSINRRHPNRRYSREVLNEVEPTGNP